LPCRTRNEKEQKKKRVVWHFFETKGKIGDWSEVYLWSVTKRMKEAARGSIPQDENCSF
jgi:hypothetical protein